MNDLDYNLKQIIIDNCGPELSVEDIREETNIYQDFGLDSIKILNIISDIEMQFHIMLSLDEIQLLKEYRLLKNYLEDQLNQEESGHHEN
jgi:acyl carrier protein